jgi:hypothetical protein
MMSDTKKALDDLKTMIDRIAVSPQPLTNGQIVLLVSGFLKSHLSRNSGCQPGRIYCVNCGAATPIAPSLDEYGGDQEREYPFQPMCPSCSLPVVSSHSLLAAAGVLAETVGLCESCGTAHTMTGERYCVVCGVSIE